MAIAGNPFVDVYQALWTLAESSVALTALVRPSNRIRFDQTRPGDPVKREVSEADLPELTLTVTSAGGNLRNTSSSTMITNQYEWIVATGDLSVKNALLPVNWALFAAMVNWPQALATLQWNGKPFVKRSQLVSVNAGFSDPERNRGIRGWSSIWAIEVEMHFATADLLQVGT